MKKKISRINNVTWMDIESPNQELIEMLRQRYNFNSLDLMYHESDLHISKFDMHQRYLFLVVQIPSSFGKQELHPRGLEVFLGPDFIVTLHKDSFDELESVFRSIEQDMTQHPSPLKQTPGYVLYQLLLSLSEISMEWLTHTKKEIEELKVLSNTHVFQGRQIQHAHQTIAHLEEQMTRLHSLMAPQREVISRLMAVDMAFMSLSLHVYGNELYQRIEHIVQESFFSMQMLKSIQKAERLRIARLQFEKIRAIADWLIAALVALTGIGLFITIELAFMGILATRLIGFPLFIIILVGSVAIVYKQMKKQ